MGALASGSRSAPEARALGCLPFGAAFWGDYQLNMGSGGPSAGVHHSSFYRYQDEKGETSAAYPRRPIGLDRLSETTTA